MKRQLYLYLFIISALIAAFTYMYYNKQIVHNQSVSDTKIKMYSDSLKMIQTQIEDANHFSLENNQNAQEYLSNYDVQKLIPQIREALLAYNDSPKGNIYTGQEKIGEQKFIINKIKVLNHRWIIADYSDGIFWGDVMIKYFVEDGGKISLQVMATFIYTKDQY